MSQPYLSFVPAGASSRPYELQNRQRLVKSNAAFSQLLGIIEERQLDIVKIYSEIENLVQELSMSVKTI